MAKTCKEETCSYPVFSHGFCANHQSKRTDEKWLKQLSSKPVRSSRIANTSKRRYEALKKYARLREKYFKEHPVCEFPGCNSREITLHHKKGRLGALLTDKREFCSLCWPHHKWVEENPLEAQKLGLSKKRLEK